MSKKAFVSEKNGELTLGVFRDANPRMLIGIDLGLPTMPHFSLELPFPEDEAINANHIFNAGVAVLVEQFHVFLNERGFVENDIVEVINNLRKALETFETDQPEAFNQDDPGEVVEVKFPLTESFWNQIQQHEISNKVAEYVNHALEFELRLQQRDQNQKAKEDAAKAISQFKNNIYKNSPGQLFVMLFDRNGKPSGVSRVTNQGLTKWADNILDDPKKWIAEKKAMMKVSYVSHCPGHKDSEGNSAPWCIRSHETGKILRSFKTKAEAAKGLKDMHIFAAQNKYSLFNNETFNFGPTLNSNKLPSMSYHGDFSMEDDKAPFLESPKTKVRKSGSLIKQAANDVPKRLLQALEIMTDEPKMQKWDHDQLFDEDNGKPINPDKTFKTDLDGGWRKPIPTYNIVQRLKDLRKNSGLSLPVLGEGSSRVALGINKHSVLKLAKNEAGVAQNKTEYSVYEKVETCSMITQIFYYAEDFEWLICERSTRETEPGDFECYGAPHGDDGENLAQACKYGDFEGNEIDEEVDPQSLEALRFLIQTMNLLPGDMYGKNWGIVERDGQEYPVLLDYGFDYDTKRNHYSSVDKTAAEIIETDQGEGTTRKITLTLDSMFGSWLITLEVDPTKEFILGTAEVGDKVMRVRGKDGRDIERDLKSKIDWHYIGLKKELKKAIDAGKMDYTYQDLEMDNAKLIQEMLYNIESYMGPEQPKTRW